MTTSIHLQVCAVQRRMLFSFLFRQQRYYNAHVSPCQEPFPTANLLRSCRISFPGENRQARQNNGTLSGKTSEGYLPGKSPCYFSVYRFIVPANQPLDAISTISIERRIKAVICSAFSGLLESAARSYSCFISRTLRSSFSRSDRCAMVSFRLFRMTL